MKVNWEGLLPIQGEIVVVEDDPTLRLLMVDIVSEIGATVRQFDSADDALTYLTSGSREMSYGDCGSRRTWADSGNRIY